MMMRSLHSRPPSIRRLLLATVWAAFMGAPLSAALSDAVEHGAWDHAYAQGNSGGAQGNQGGGNQGGGNQGGGNQGGGNQGGGNQGGGNQGGGNQDGGDQGGGNQGGGQDTGNGGGSGGGNSGGGNSDGGNSGGGNSGSDRNDSDRGRSDSAPGIGSGANGAALGGSPAAFPGAGGLVATGNGSKPALGAARGRYNAATVTPAADSAGTAPGAVPATGLPQSQQEDGDDSFSSRIGGVAVELDEDATRALIESGWATPVPSSASAPQYEFSEQSERVRTFVRIARTLNDRFAETPGFTEIPIPAAALQASFGTPWEGGILLRPGVQANGTTVSTNDVPATDDQAELDRRMARMGPQETVVQGWEAMTALDVNGDGYVDLKDLYDLEAGRVPAYLGGGR